MSAISMAGAERMLGFSYLVSSGNEAVTDLADYVEHFVGDDAVTVIALIVEQIRRPEAFVAAAVRGPRSRKADHRCQAGPLRDR